MRKELSNFEVTIPDGQIEVFYLDGQKYSGIIYREFKGFIISEFEVKNGTKDGMEKEFLTNGTITSAINYEEGQEEGTGKYYYESGKLKEEIYFEMGQLIWSSVYDEDGKLTNRYEIDKSSSAYRRLQLYKNERKKNRM